MSEPKHTPEPWQTYGQHQNKISDARGDARGHVAHCEEPADARRIVVCVNACAGISTADLERFAAAKKAGDKVYLVAQGKTIPATGQPDAVSDTERLEWALPILTGEDSANADALAKRLAVALLCGLDGRAAIDAAMQTSGGE